MNALLILFIGGISAILAATAFVLFVFIQPAIHAQEEEQFAFSLTPWSKDRVDLAVVGKIIEEKRGPNDGPIKQQISILETQDGQRLKVCAPKETLHKDEVKMFTLFKWKGCYMIVALDLGKFSVRGDMITDKRYRGMEISDFGRMMGMDIEIPDKPQPSNVIR